MRTVSEDYSTVHIVSHVPVCLTYGVLSSSWAVDFDPLKIITHGYDELTWHDIKLT